MVRRRKRRISHQQKLLLFAFACGVPGLLASLILLIAGDYTLKAYLTVIILGGGVWIYFAFRLQNHVIRPLQTASNMLSALREGDFSLQASYVDSTDPLGQVMLEINLLTDVLSGHRSGAMEAHALLDKVVEEIDAAVITLDPDRKITSANQAAKSIFGRQDSMKGLYAGELNLDGAIESPPNATIPSPVEGKSTRYTIRRGTYRVGGKSHLLLILIDVSRDLREEELLAWKRLIRVLGHELNNSMAPIKSLAESLRKIVKRSSIDEEDREDIMDGLEVIQTRSDGLSRFVQDYARLAKLPPPQLKAFDFPSLVRRLVNLSEKGEITIDQDSPDIELIADQSQIEQLLINLLKNAVEAAEETKGKVFVRWQVSGKSLCLEVLDTGHGIANLENLFIPFFSTKKGGSGIGLTLSRQIAEAHKGSLDLENRKDGPGSRAVVVLPLR